MSLLLGAALLFGAPAQAAHETVDGGCPEADDVLAVSGQIHNAQCTRPELLSSTDHCLRQGSYIDIGLGVRDGGSGVWCRVSDPEKCGDDNNRAFAAPAASVLQTFAGITTGQEHFCQLLADDYLVCGYMEGTYHLRMHECGGLGPAPLPQVVSVDAETETVNIMVPGAAGVDDFWARRFRSASRVADSSQCASADYGEFALSRPITFETAGDVAHPNIVDTNYQSHGYCYRYYVAGRGLYEFRPGFYATGETPVGTVSVHMPFLPYAPNKPTAILNSAQATVDISWTNPTPAVEQPAISSYTVERQIGNGSWAKVGENLTDTAYTDTNTALDNAYRYRITAHSSVGASPLSEASDTITLHCGAGELYYADWGCVPTTETLQCLP